MHIAVVLVQELVTPVLLAQVGTQSFTEDRALARGFALFVPVRHLDTDEHADHHDREVDADCGPVLFADVFDDAA